MGVIRLYATLRPRAGNAREVEVPWSPDDSIGAVIREVIRLKPGLSGYILDDDGAPLRFVSIFVNGRDIRHLDGLDTRVDDATEVSIFPPVAGG